MRPLIGGLCLAFCVVISSQAHAGFPGVFGIGAEEIARGGTSLNYRSVSPFAAFTNPAALGFAEKPSLSVGVMGMDVSLRSFGRIVINESGTRGTFDTSGVLDGRGQMVGLLIPLGKRTRPVTLGVVAYLSGESVSRVSGPPINNPYYPIYQDVNRNAAYTISAGYRIWNGLSIGFAGNTSLLSIADYRLVNASGASFSASTVEVRSAFSPTYSAAYDFSREEGLPLRVGFSRRGKSELKTKLLANVEVQGVPVVGELTSYPHFSPAEWNLGASYGFADGWTASADITRAEWSDYKSPFGTGNINSFIFGAGTQDAGFQDIWVPRFGLDWKRDLTGFIREIAYRAGYFYHPTPVRDQNGNSNYADSNRHGISAGLGLAFDNPWTESLFHVDFFGQWNRIVERKVTKNRSTDLGAPGYVVGGEIWLYGLAVSLSF
jgi:long-subunit fatty acid transport protein